MKRWTQDEIEMLKKYYPIKGSKYCAGLLHRSRKAISIQAIRIGLHTRFGLGRWTAKEESQLKKYYPICGIKYCAELLGRTTKSIKLKAFRLDLHIDFISKYWTKDEEDVLREYYSISGSKYCANLLDRSCGAIRSRAKLLGIKTNIVIGGLPQKQIVKYLNDIRVVARCKKHGETPHYFRNGKILQCLQCHCWLMKQRMKTVYGKASIKRAHEKYKSTLVGKLRYRLQTSLNNALKSKNIRKTKRGCFRFLPYSPQEFTEHLESIRLKQNDKCPMCCQSYSIKKWTIDHIVPISVAQTEEDVLELFNLDNLSLLCGSCNTSKGKRILTHDRIEEMRVNGY